VIVLKNWSCRNIDDLNFKIIVTLCFKFFRRNEDIIKNFVDVSIDIPPNPNSYNLTEEGKKVIQLISQFKKYYASI